MVIQLAHLIISCFLIGAIVIQARSSAFGNLWGGKEFLSSKRGFEKTVFLVTVVLATLFLAGALANTLIGLK